MSVKKTIGKSNQKRGSSSKAPSFSDPAEVASAFRDGKKGNWTCGFCNWRVAVAKGDSFKVVKHIRTRHPAEYIQDSAISAVGSGKKRGVSGFGIRGIKIPVDLSGKRRGLFAPIVRRAPQRISPDMSGLLRRGITWINVIPSPRRSLMKLFRDYASSRHGAFRRSKYFSQRGHIYTRCAHQLALQRGHDAVFSLLPVFLVAKWMFTCVGSARLAQDQVDGFNRAKRSQLGLTAVPAQHGGSASLGPTTGNLWLRFCSLVKKKRLTSAKCWRSEGQFPCILYAVGAARGMCYRFIYVFAMRFWNGCFENSRFAVFLKGNLWKFLIYPCFSSRVSRILGWIVQW